jgi:hypothetical protein
MPKRPCRHIRAWRDSTEPGVTYKRSVDSLAKEKAIPRLSRAMSNIRETYLVNDIKRQLIKYNFCF